MSCQKTDSTQDEGLVLKKAEKSMAIDLNGPHFELNLVAKKDNWNENEFNNPERHTIFIPRDTEGWNIILNQPNNLGSATLPGVRIDMTQGTEFAVLDGSVFDGDKAEFQLGPGKYQVVIAMRGKKNVELPPYIASWLEALETTTITNPDGTVVSAEEFWYYQLLGTVTVTRKWTNITDMFMISQAEAGGLPWPVDVNGAPLVDQWIFDYMDWLGLQTITITNPDGTTTTMAYSDLAYFWQLVNHGSQLIKVRFYPV
jgi:hypothetical protein